MEQSGVPAGGRRDDGVAVQETRNLEDSIGLAPHRGPAIRGGRDDGHQAAARTGGTEDPPGDLAPVRDQQPRGGRHRRSYCGPSGAQGGGTFAKNAAVPACPSSEARAPAMVRMVNSSMSRGGSGASRNMSALA